MGGRAGRLERSPERVRRRRLRPLVVALRVSVREELWCTGRAAHVVRRDTPALTPPAEALAGPVVQVARCTVDGDVVLVADARGPGCDRAAVARLLRRE